MKQYVIRALVMKSPGWPTDRQILELVLAAAEQAPVPAYFFYDDTLFRFQPRGHA